MTNFKFEAARAAHNATKAKPWAHRELPPELSPQVAACARVGSAAHRRKESAEGIWASWPKVLGRWVARQRRGSKASVNTADSLDDVPKEPEVTESQRCLS